MAPAWWVAEMGERARMGAKAGGGGGERVPTARAVVESRLRLR